MPAAVAESSQFRRPLLSSPPRVSSPKRCRQGGQRNRRVNKKMIKSLLTLPFLSTLIFFFFCFVSQSQARSNILRTRPPLESSSFKVNTSQENLIARRCSYTVRITTSCYSPRYTRDQISLAFGDAYGNQVYAPRIDDPYTRTFESCSVDTFDIYGPCTYDICYLYLYRSGYDGWLPSSVEVYGSAIRPVSFYYNVYIPPDIWYGFDYCYYAAASKPISTSDLNSGS